MLNFNSLTEKQLSSIKSIEVLLNMCICKGKFSINIIIIILYY